MKEQKNPLNKVSLLSLRPTQFAVGMLEVNEKIKIVEKYGKKELKKYLIDNPVPVVVGPDGKMYVIDHHHFLCVCYHLGIKKVYVETVKDLSTSDLGYSKFWKWMNSTRNTYPYCQFGEGPRLSLYLPKDIKGLADDPYRSLAWFVRKSGAFENSDKNFAEFTWANFFRSKKILDREGHAGFEKALLRAVKLAQSPEAKKLPGYGKLNLVQQRVVKARAKKKAKEVELAEEKA
ncbi:MAG TPA: ParB/Srx family N-terminal domain-containing protein [Bacteriovoracaceae bacterium]|nr:ParB/Srx family N-terminal domain-containing protein [Bacteriovoracaceae bacterium]